MNITQIAAFAKSLKNKKNEPTKQKRKLVVKTNNRNHNYSIPINPIILQQTGHTNGGKVFVR